MTMTPRIVPLTCSATVLIPGKSRLILSLER